MPTMFRPDQKPKKLAYKIVGVPINMVIPQTPKEKKIDDRVVFEASAYRNRT